jgi:hypothetical protein
MMASQTSETANLGARADQSQITKIAYNSFITPIFQHHKPPTLKLLATLVFIGLSYLSMSFLSRFIRPFSMSTAPASPMNVPAGAQTATIAAGCFWGVEHMYRKDFGNKGLLDARVGYIGGDTQNPGYRAVCSGRTGRMYYEAISNYWIELC